MIVSFVHMQTDNFICTLYIYLKGNFTDHKKFTCDHSATDPVGYECLNRQAEELTQHLVLRSQWSYTQLPLDGLKSVVFHGNSPTLCIASGDVWVDSSWQARGIDISQAMCITPKDVLKISPEATFDLAYFFQQDPILGYCLRGRNPAHTKIPPNQYWKPY